jgi:ribosomal protein RSM22 (predicted rRNA methylase)
LLAAIDAVAAQRLGRDNLDGPLLAQAVARVSAAYRRQHGTPATLNSDPQALCARLKFFLPRDFPKIQAPLRELLAVGALPTAKSLRILDVGAGLGTTGLAAAAFALSQPGVEQVRIDAVDSDPGALDLAAQLCRRWAPGAGLDIDYRVVRAPLTPALLDKLDPPYHVIVLGFVLNELGDSVSDPVAHHHAWLMRLGRLLTDDGALVVLEPALRDHCRVLQQVRGLFVDADGPPYVFAPCLHRDACPMLDRERDFCHERLPLELPDSLARIARAAGLRDSDLSYSYLTLHRQARSLAELGPAGPLLRVVSAPLGSKGKIEVAVCGPGTVRRMRRLDRHASDLNDALSTAGRGTILSVPDAVTAADSVLAIEPDSRVDLLLATSGKA